MENQMRPDEMRIVIRPVDEPADSTRPIPAKTFKKSFNSVFEALKAADAELHDKKHRSEFFISHLAMGSNIIGVFEQRRAASPSLSPSIDFFKECASFVYRSEYGRVAEHIGIAKSIVKIGAAIDENYPSTVCFPGGDIPLDGFFAKQAQRLSAVISEDPIKFPFFTGSAIGSFDGRIESLDYRGAAWKGALILPGGEAQIECIFDRSKGENEYNPFGNKRVSVTGRAIYTGDSQLPERIEVITIQEFPLAGNAVDIRGSLRGKQYFVGWNVEDKSFQ